MCKITDQLTLCTCKNKKVAPLENHWILYQYKKSELAMVGTAALPQDFSLVDKSALHNHKTIESLLNTRNCFDFDIDIKNKDILEIHLNCKPKHNTHQNIQVSYAFVFNKNSWKAKTYDPFDTDKHEKNKGKVVLAFTQ